MNRHRAGRPDARDRHQPLHLRAFPGPDTDLLLEVGNPPGERGNLRERQRGHRRHLLGKRTPNRFQFRAQLLETARTQRRDNAEPGEMASQRIDRLRALPHKQRKGAEQHRITLRHLRIHRHEPHGRALGRLDDRGCVVAVILLPLDERFHVHRRDQLARVTLVDDRTTPVVGATAGLHHHQARRHFGQERQKPAA